jgi:hypothetical protein
MKWMAVFLLLSLTLLAAPSASSLVHRVPAGAPLQPDVIGSGRGWVIVAVYPDDVPLPVDIPAMHLSSIRNRVAQIPQYFESVGAQKPPFTIILSHPFCYCVGPIEMAERKDVKFWRITKERLPYTYSSAAFSKITSAVPILPSLN